MTSLLIKASVILALAAYVSSSEDGEEYRLPKNIVPKHYEFKFFFDINEARNFSYFGVATIELSVVSRTDKIILHGKDYKLKEEAIKLSEGVAVKNIERDVKKDFVIFHLDKFLEAGQAITAFIPFYGNLGLTLDGIYISKYDDEKNGKEWMVTTQFEATSARNSFPCFDEPALKATFSIGIARPADYNALSNMPVSGTADYKKHDADWFWSKETDILVGENPFKWDQFSKSVPMATYLLAMVVSKMVGVTSDPSLTTAQFKTWARRDAVNQTEYASRIGPQILSFYEEFFNIKYPLPKQDMIAIPDFSAGAMENWGIITYRETALLYDENDSSLTQKENVASVVAHELAHQWFGNLVTMEWWTDLWLNEGFATYVGAVGVRNVEPTWKHDEIEAVENMWNVFYLDALNSSHPISVPVQNPDTIGEIFDVISYKKGANVIRMMNSFLTESVFREGITAYLKKHSYANAKQDDLWESLTESAAKHGVLKENTTVKQIMDTWTKQIGYPLLTVNRNYQDGSVYVQQARYLSLPSAKKSNEAWWIPLNVMSENEVNRSSKSQVLWLSNKEGVNEQHKLDYSVDKKHWILLNSDFSAIMRVNYDPENWRLLAETLNSDSFTNIPVLARAQLISDAFQLAKTNIIEYSTPLSMVMYLERETEYIPLMGSLNALAGIEKHLKRTKDYGAYQKFVRKLITPIYRKVGGIYSKAVKNSDDMLGVKMQTLTSSWACKVHVPQCQDNAMEMFDDWMITADPDVNNPVPLDLRSTVYSIAIRRGSVEQWAFLFSRYRGSNVAAAKSVMLSALTATNEIWLLKQLLEWCVTPDSDVRSQDVPLVMSQMARSYSGYYVLKEFLYQRIDDIFNIAFHGQSRRIGSVIDAVVSQFTTEYELNEFISWRGKNDKYLESSKAKINQAIEGARISIEWVKHNEKTVVQKLREFSA